MMNGNIHPPISVLVSGASGRMGRMVVEILNRYPHDWVCVGQTRRGDDLRSAIAQAKPHIVFDVTTAEVVDHHAQVIIESGARPLIGTSGLSTERIDALKTICQTGGLIVPNFSIGAILMMKFAKMAAPYFQHIEIVEHHHPHKKDAPSGTAIKTASMMAQALACSSSVESDRSMASSQNSSLDFSGSNASMARGMLCHGIPIHSVRMSGVLAQQSVYLGHLGEMLTLSHQVLDRSAFEKGICFSLHQVMMLDRLVYGLESLI